MTRYILLLSTALILASCGGGGKSSEIVLDPSDAIQQQIFNYRDKRAVQELLPYFAYEDPVYRYAATLAFSSIQDSTALDDLVRRLNDNNLLVRQVAAYAIGQLKSKAALGPLVDAFQQMKQDSLYELQAMVLEAIGKCGTRKELFQLSVAPNYTHDKTGLLIGQARAIYQFALRDSLLAEGTRRMVELASSPDVAPEVRFIAANYLSRAKNIDLTKYEDALTDAAIHEADAKIRMPLVIGLSKSKGLKAMEAIKTLWAKENDYRVRCNMVRGFRFFPYDSIAAMGFKALQDPNPHVQECASEYFMANGIDKDVELYRQGAEASSNWRVRAQMYTAALHATNPFRSATRAMLSKTVTDRYKGSSNVYEKSLLIEAMGEFPWNYMVIAQEIFPLDSAATPPAPVIRTSGVTALVKILQDPNFNLILGFSAAKAKQDITNVLIRAIATADPGMSAVAAEALVDPSLNLKALVPDYNFLMDARAKFVLPRDIESYNAVQKAIDYFAGTKTAARKSEFKDPIDWALLRSLPPNAKAFVQTDKGVFAFQLFPADAPGSVANFVKLAREGFFDGKVFHRVVPNFVIQTGCPRGDGYGGIDRGLRTEISTLRYDDEGWVGMASAGKDTEGSQWFVTHSATMHLDGNYTIFGKVTDGMDVVQGIEMGDKITKVEIK